MWRFTLSAHGLLNRLRGIQSERCERAGSYRRDGLMARLGPDAALPHILMALATCARRGDFSRPRGARFTDVAARL